MDVAADRLYSLIHVKSLDEEQRIIEGIATTPTPDRVDDVVEPAGVKFRNPLPFILHHDRKSPVGQVHFGRATPSGIPFTAQIPKVTEPGIVRDRTDEAWHSAKYGLLRGVSIGYRPLEATQRASGGLHLKSIEVVELSMVAVPANAETTILQIKSLDAAARAVSGKSARGPVPPGVPGNARTAAMNTPISDQIAHEKRDLQTKSARLDELIAKEDQDGGLSDVETKERDAITAGVDALVKKIARLATQEAAQAALGTPVSYAPSGARPTDPPRVQVVTPTLEKGTLFTRYAMAIAAGRGSYSDSLAYARRWDGQTPQVSAYLKETWGLSGDRLSDFLQQKATQGVALSGTPAWGAELAYPNNLASEFVDLLRAATIIGRIAGFRRVPFNVRVGVQTGGSTVGWVGEAAVKPVGELDFTEATLTTSKVAGIVVLSDELIRLSTPSAEQTVRTDLTNAAQEFLDQQLVDPTVAAGANNPASLTNTAVAVPATGTDVTAFLIDLNSAMANFDAVEIDTGSVVIVTTTAIARGLASLRNTLGGSEFPNMSVTGGSILGMPVIVSNSVPTGLVVFIAANEVWLADDGGVTLDASNQATLDMNGSTTPNFSLWQRNCTAIRAERWIRWQKRRAAAVQYISGAAYGPTATT